MLVVWSLDNRENMFLSFPSHGVSYGVTVGQVILLPATQHNLGKLNSDIILDDCSCEEDSRRIILLAKDKGNCN